MADTPLTLPRYKFENYLKEIYLDSDTKVALLSGAPFDDPSWWLLSNDQIRDARGAINKVAGSRRMFGHSVFTPGQAGWMEEVDRGHRRLQAGLLEGLHHRRPAVAVHQGHHLAAGRREAGLSVLREGHASPASTRSSVSTRACCRSTTRQSWPGVWQYATVDDVPKAAKDWPRLQLHHVPRRAAAVPGGSGLRAGPVREDRRHPLGHRSGQDAEEVRRQQRVRRAGHDVRDLCGGQPALRGRGGRPARQWTGRRITWYGAPTRCGTARRSGRSKPCAGSRSRTT